LAGVSPIGAPANVSLETSPGRWQRRAVGGTFAARPVRRLLECRSQHLTIRIGVEWKVCRVTPNCECIAHRLGHCYVNHADWAKIPFICDSVFRMQAIHNSEESPGLDEPDFIPNDFDGI
jgi:hypothetical protein